jgi:hypothetical protein
MAEKSSDSDAGIGTNWLSLLSWPALLIGISISGFVAGTMTGLSASPVVGAILPALISAVFATLAISFQNSDKRRVFLPMQIGLVLVFFCSWFWWGTEYGSNRRVHELNAVTPTLKEIAEDSRSQNEALDKIDLYRVLQGQGFADETIQKIVRLSPTTGIEKSPQQLSSIQPSPLVDQNMPLPNAHETPPRSAPDSRDALRRPTTNFLNGWPPNKVAKPEATEDAGPRIKKD